MKPHQRLGFLNWLLGVIGTMIHIPVIHGTPSAQGNLRGFWVEQLVSGLNYPSDLAWLPDGNILISERQGDLRIVRSGKLDPKPISGMPGSVQALQLGFKDFALDPDFKTNSTLYLLISEGTLAAHHAALYRAILDKDALHDVQRIFRGQEETHSVPVAERLLFLADKTLLVVLPVSGATHKGPAQELNSQIGKIIRLNRDGTVPADNPFVTTPGALPEIWSLGHRVPTGLYRDATEGLIWEVEAGPRGGDELNILKPGGNYGWPKVSWGFDYTGELIAPAQSGVGIEDPVLVWTPSITPSSIVRYQGKVYPQWQGDYFIGALTGKALLRLRIRDRQVLLQERLLLDLGERIRSVRVGPDQHLYVLTDHQNGRLLRLNPGDPSSAQSTRVTRKLAEPAFTDVSPVPGNVTQGKRIFVESCVACHTVGTLVLGGKVGPDLAGVVGRKAGSQPGFSYSSAMIDSQRTWDVRSLNAFLSSPATFVPGTSMAAAPVADAEARGHLIEFLKRSAP